MKRIDLSKATLRLLTADETGGVAGAAPATHTCTLTGQRTCQSAVLACQQTVTCAPCSCPGPTFTHLPPCPA